MIQINKRRVGMCILLSIITFGIYNIYWMYLLVKNTRSIQQNDRSCLGEMLCYFVVPFYSWYWWFTRGKKVTHAFAAHHRTTTANGAAYLILSIFGLDIVSMAIMQHDFNALKSEDIFEQRGGLHITKRDAIPMKYAILIRVAAILLSLIFCGIVTIILTGDNPISIYITIFEGAFGNANDTQFLRLWATLQDIAILLCISLAVTPAFKMRFWNTGAEGQVLIGCLATAICMFTLGGVVPDPVLILIMTVCSILAGVLWGVIPAFFKAFWGTNETLFTLMMNYVAIQLIEVFLKIADKSGSNTVGPSLLSHGWFPSLFGQKYLLNILIVAVITVLTYIYLKYTKHGYEIAVVGESENTARYIGINVKKVIIRTMAISGALCGVAGLLLVGGTSHSIDANLADGRGFTAIMVSWLAKFNPLMMVLTTALLVILDRGASEVSTKFGLNSSFSDILTGIILFFIIGCEFFIQYRVHINKKHKLFSKKADTKEVA